MQAIRQTALLNKRELENAVPPSASWHADYRDTAWLFCGGFPFDLSEGDVLTIFSQFGNPTHLNLIRDKETGKSKGFGFLKYEDQRSCDLAVDNLGGAKVLDRMLRVDHARYKKKDGEDEETFRVDRLEKEANGNGKAGPASDTEDEGEGRRKRRKLLKEERELEEMLAIKSEDGEEQDPMKEYLIQEKRNEAIRARQRGEEGERKRKHRHRQRDDDKRNDPAAERPSRRHRRRDRSRENDNERERDGRPYQSREDNESGRRHRHRNEEGDRDREQDPERADSADDQERSRKLGKHRSGRDHRRRRDSRSSSP